MSKYPVRDRGCVKLFFDEDMGAGIPTALRSVGIPGIACVGPTEAIKPGTPDEDWLPWAGQNGYLVFSCNTGILVAEAQRNILIEERVGAVFLTTGEVRSRDVLKLILNQWEWLEWIDETEERPFAYLITISGRKTLVDLANPDAYLKRRGSR